MTITIAFAGNGETSKANVFDLLNDYTHGQEVELLFPVPGSSGKHMSHVLDWVADESDAPIVAILEEGHDPDKTSEWILKEADNTIRTSDVDTALVTYLKPKNGVLVALFGDEPDNNTKALVEIALDQGVQVVDLTAGLDDILLEPEAPVEEPAPEPEQTPGPVTPARQPTGGNLNFGPASEKMRMPAIGFGDGWELINNAMGRIHHEFPESRDRELILEKLEEARFWVTVAAAKYLPAPEPERVGTPIREVWDEAEEKWVPKGKGRPRKDQKVRTVDSITGKVLEDA